jgi:hypothetical protein
MGVEHPSGEAYAFYLTALADANGLNVQTGTEVTAVRPAAKGVGFWVDVDKAGGREEGTPPMEPLRARYVIWAAGEFQYPSAPGASQMTPDLFPGAELCRHNSSVRSWKELPGDDYVVVGGYESGMDAAFNLAACGKRCTVAASKRCWTTTTDDPSSELAPYVPCSSPTSQPLIPNLALSAPSGSAEPESAPRAAQLSLRLSQHTPRHRYTVQRVNDALAMPTPPRLLAPLRVEQVQKAEGDAGYVVHARWGAAEEQDDEKSRQRVTALEEGPIWTGEEGAEVGF